MKPGQTVEELQAQLAEMQKKLEQQQPVVKLKITEKGNLSISGLKPGWPLTLDPQVWRLLDAKRDEIAKFLEEHEVKQQPQD